MVKVVSFAGRNLWIDGDDSAPGRASNRECEGCEVNLGDEVDGEYCNECESTCFICEASGRPSRIEPKRYYFHECPKCFNASRNDTIRAGIEAGRRAGVGIDIYLTSKERINLFAEEVK